MFLSPVMACFCVLNGDGVQQRGLNQQIIYSILPQDNSHCCHYHLTMENILLGFSWCLVLWNRLVIGLFALSSLIQSLKFVYSSETKDWKLSVKLENFDLLSVNFTDGVSWNGAVHWMSPMGNGLSFLLDMECLQTIPRLPLPENWQDKNFRYFGESGGQLHFIGILAGNQNPDDLSMGIVSPDMSHDQSTDQSIVVYSMERGCSNWFAKYCLHMNAIVMAYPEITGDRDPTASPFSAEKWFDLLSFIERNDEEEALLVMRISGEIISCSFKNNILKKILSFPLKHATCYAFNYTETLSCV